MTVPNDSDPGPRTVPGLEPAPGPGREPVPEPGWEPGFGPGSGAARGVPPGETPPAESGTGTGTGPYRPLKSGWAAGPLLVLAVAVLVFALFFAVYGIMLMVG
ncbi:DUF6480 family protein [Streptomyces griseus]|uniref:DUF6480 family protein n=1 Tax=Streptomyces griseus TaxID=1911 RepID=UPI0004CA9638|nr:DUF6480 family protein [Streptomyces griseus]